MPSKSSSKRALEWVFGYVDTTDSTTTTYTIDLGLRDDEVAEIWRIDSQIDSDNIPDDANDEVAGHMMLSMDPDANADPGVSANHDDLEVFYEHSYNVQQEVGAAGTATLVLTDRASDTHYPYPVLVGTDVGMIVDGDADVNMSFWARLFFTRRRASTTELNQILLKRR
jgi:hypothetical protein